MLLTIQCKSLMFDLETSPEIYVMLILIVTIMFDVKFMIRATGLRILFHWRLMLFLFTFCCNVVNSYHVLVVSLVVWN